jgi:hypothetical protein
MDGANLVGGAARRPATLTRWGSPADSPTPVKEGKRANHRFGVQCALSSANAHRILLTDCDHIDDVAKIMHSEKWPDFLNVDHSIQQIALGADSLVPTFG